MKVPDALLLGGLVLFAGCAGAVPAPAELGMDEPSPTTEAPEGEQDRPVAQPTAPSSTPRLHFTKDAMSPSAPSGSETAEHPLTWRWSLISPPYAGFSHVATHNGTLTRANATLWFKVTELTPADALSCHFGLSMRIVSANGPAYAGRFVSFCSQYLPDSALPIAPGTYKIETEAYLSQPVPIQYGDTVFFMPQTGGISLEQRKSVFFLYNSGAHDSVVHFEGWDEGKS